MHRMSKPRTNDPKLLALLALLERAKAHGMTPVERDAQMRSFVRGQTGREPAGPTLASLLADAFAAGRAQGLREAAEAARGKTTIGGPSLEFINGYMACQKSIATAIEALAGEKG